MIELDSKKYLSDRIYSLEEFVCQKLEEIRKLGQKIGLCAGSFDLLHPGHITHLVSAKKSCDCLVVAVARDESCKNKHETFGRPIYSHDIRAFMVASLKPVDFVVLDYADKKTIEQIQPDVFFKGSDYSDRKNPIIAEVARYLEERGKKVIFTEDEKFSTSDVIKYIQRHVSLVR